MKGTRPLNNDEIRRVSACFTGTFEVRNRGLFMLGVSTGGRISELLSLYVGDVYQNGKPVTDLLFDKSIVKGKETSRAVPVNVDGRLAIAELVNWHRDRYGDLDANRPLFPSWLNIMCNKSHVGINAQPHKGDENERVYNTTDISFSHCCIHWFYTLSSVFTLWSSQKHGGNETRETTHS